MTSPASKSIQEKIKEGLIDIINTGADGRLIIFKPQDNRLNADLVVEKRGGYKETPCSAQIFGFMASLEPIVADFSTAKVPALERHYGIFVQFDLITQKIRDDIWLVPAVKLHEMEKFDASHPENARFAAKASHLGDFFLSQF